MIFYAGDRLPIASDFCASKVNEMNWLEFYMKDLSRCARTAGDVQTGLSFHTVGLRKF
jgi:hypothetical protein